jgi:hypothetical protein
MSLGTEVERALRQALACRDDRKRAEQTLETLRHKENDAVDHLQDLVRRAFLDPPSSKPPTS